MVNVCLEGMGNHKMLKGNKQHVFEKEREKIIFDLHKIRKTHTSRFLF